LFSTPIIENVPLLSNDLIKVDTLRLDQIHAIISGNKWYKLRFYIQEALNNNATTMASFGGPYSNHIVALAYGSKINGLRSIGYIRANKGEPITPTLQEAIDYGMELVFLGRTLFQEKKNELLVQNKNGVSKTYFVNEGGYGILGAKGATTIVSDWDSFNKSNHSITETYDLAKNPIHKYDYIICAVGTGTMIAGIINATKINQTIVGIPVLKNEDTIKQEIENLLEDKNVKFELHHTFHQGGYAKTSPAQIEFMNRLWNHEKIPTDIVYTSKVFYAVEQLIKENYFKPNTKVLIIHSGGLQGNRSLEKGILLF